MRIDVNNLDREPLFRAQVDQAQRPGVARSSDGAHEAALNWDRAIDEGGQLRRCPVCGCRELFARRDFPQAVGLGIVVVAGVLATVLFAMGQVVLSVMALGGTVVIDGAILLMTGRCLVCYRCRSEFRGLTIERGYPAWDLGVGEKYRPVRAVEDGADGKPKPIDQRREV